MPSYRNVVPNPNAAGPNNAFESQTGMTVGFGDSGTVPLNGGRSFVLTTGAATAAIARLRAVDRGAATPGQRWHARLKLRNDSWTTRAFDVTLQPYASAPGATLGTALTSPGGTYLEIPGGAIREFIINGVMPASTQSIGLTITRRAAPNGAAGDTIVIDDVMLYQSEEGNAIPYGDPDVDPRWYWTGTPRASQSRLVVATPILTPLTNMDPCPRIRIDFPEFAANVGYVSVIRSVEGRVYDVPGANYIPASGSVLVEDYYAPLNFPVSYQAEMFSEAGASLGWTEIATTTLPETRSFIQSPSDPRKVVAVEFAAQAGSELTEVNTGTVHQIGDRRVLIAAGGTGLDDLNMDFYTDTLAQYRAALEVFRDAKGLVVIRTPPPMLVPRVLYFWSPKPSRAEWNLPAGMEEVDWSNTGVEVSPPAAKALVSPVSYGRYTAALPLYATFKAAYSTYGEALRNPPAVV
jgi:hypothetical protein